MCDIKRELQRLHNLRCLHAFGTLQFHFYDNKILILLRHIKKLRDEEYLEK